MIYIDHRGTSEITLYVLRDNPTFCPECISGGTSFGMVFRSSDHLNAVYARVEDLSPSPRSFQLFELTTAEVQDPDNGVVDLSPIGQWTVSIHPCNGLSIDDIDASRTLWSGLAIIS